MSDREEDDRKKNSERYFMKITKIVLVITIVLISGYFIYEFLKMINNMTKFNKINAHNLPTNFRGNYNNNSIPIRSTKLAPVNSQKYYNTNNLNSNKKISPEFQTFLNRKKFDKINAHNLPTNFRGNYNNNSIPIRSTKLAPVNSQKYYNTNNLNSNKKISPEFQTFLNRKKFDKINAQPQPQPQGFLETYLPKFLRIYG